MKNFNKYIKNAIQQDPNLKKEMEFELWLSEIGLNIARLRKNKGYTQKTFAQKLGVSQSAVARMESGQNMQCYTLWVISDVLKTDLEILGTDKEIEKQEFAYFYNYTIKKEIIGATSEIKKIKFKINYPSLSLLSNLKSYATT